MKKSSSSLAATLLALFALPAAGAPAPAITGASVSPLVSTAKYTIYGMTLYGRNFWPSGPNDPNRRLLNVRRQGGSFQRVLISSMGDTELNISFPTPPLLGAPGQLEFQVTIDGMASNIFVDRIVGDPPGLAWISPDKISLDGKDDARWNVWLAGSRWIDPTTVWIDGTNVHTCYMNLNSGKEQMAWPPAFRKAGKFKVLVKTEHGDSEVRTVEVTKPILLTQTARSSALLQVASPTPTPKMNLTIGGQTAGKAASTMMKATATPTRTPTPGVRPLS